MLRWKAGACALTALAVTGTGVVVASQLGASADDPLHAVAAPVGMTVTAVSVSTSACGAGWTAPTAGRQLFVLHNTDYRTADVSLTTKAGAVVGNVESIGPGARADLRVELGGGRYTFRCAMEDADVVTGPTVRVAAPAGGGSPAVTPVTQAELIPATLRYERYVRGRLPRLTSLVRRLDSSVRTHSLHAAKAAWLAAHLEYERLGAAYGAFGVADDRINGLPSGLRRGVRSARFTGFHRVEYELWRGRLGPSTAAATGRLLTAVRRLTATFATAQIDPLQVSVRAHEIVEDTLQLELSGETDFGSGSGLATARANLAGTSVVLRLLEPLLRPRYARLPALRRQLRQTRRDLDALATRGRYPRLDSLSTSRRERVDADFSGLAELLAPVATICEPRRD